MIVGEHLVRYEAHGHVATITLNRPERRNAITGAMLAELADALLAADRNDAVRVILLTGAAPAFCAGLDLRDAATGEQSGPGMGHFMQVRNLPTVILQELDTPVIGVLNGPAVGYGFDLALGCDLRLMGSSSVLSPAFAKLGAVPESGGTWYLPRLVGWAKAAEIGYLARDITPETALDLGLANLVVADDELMGVATQWAEEIAGNAPLAVQAMKRLFRHGQTQDFQSHSHHVLLQTLHLFRTRDFREGVASVMQRRPPVFEGR